MGSAYASKTVLAYILTGRRRMMLTAVWRRERE
jgi:hypothetical protein